MKVQNFNFSRFFIFLTGIIFCTASCHILNSNNKDFDEIRLRDAIRINPKHELGYIRLAQYLEKKHLYSETIAVLQLGQKQISDSIPLIRLEGSLLQGLGLKNKTVIFYAKQIEKYPENHYLYLDRAKIRLNMNKKYLALSDAKKAHKINPDSFEALYLIGVILSQTLDQNYPNDLDKVLNSLISASQKNSKNHDLWLRISAIWEKKKNLHMAREAMIKAVELYPESEIYLRRLTFLLEKELVDAVGENSIKISESLRKTLLHMLKLFPDNSWVNAHYGNWAWSQDKFTLAEKHLKNAIRFKPIYPWAFFRLAVVYISQKKWDAALFSLKEGLNYDPENLWALQKIGFTLEMQDKKKEAIEHYEFMIEKSYVTISLINNLSELYFEEFLFKKREELLLFGMKKFPLEGTFMEMLVDYYESHSLYEEGSHILYSLLKLDPKNSAVLAKIGFFEKKLNKQEKSLMFFEKAIRISPDFEWAKIQKIILLLDTKKHKNAENELIKFLEKKPNSEWALIELSRLKIKKKQFSAAEEILKKNHILFKESTRFLQAILKLYIIQERWKEAEEISQKILKLNPNNSLILTDLSLIQWKLNKTKLARKNVKKALYENSANLIAWNINFILQPENEQKRWIGENLTLILPVLKNLLTHNYENTWEVIKSIRIDPFSRQILKNLFYIFQGYTKEIVLDPEDMTSKKLTPWVQDRWGFFHEVLGNKDLAAKHFETVSRTIPENSWVHARLGTIYEKLEKLEKSLSHYKKFLKKNPNAFEVNFRLANIHVLLGNEASAIEIYEDILFERPKNDLVLNNLAWLLLTSQDKNLRNIKKGLEYAIKSVEIFPTIDNLDTLAEAYFQSGNSNKAIEILRKAVSELYFSINRQTYLRKQLLRFKSGKKNTKPPVIY